MPTLLNEFGDFSEGIVFAVGHHFEEGGFGGGYSCAGMLHPLEGGFVIDFASGGDGVGGDKRLEVVGQEVMNRLGDADVGFNADDDNLWALYLGDDGIDVIVGHTAEGDFIIIGYFAEYVLDRLGGAAEAFRVLFGDDDGNFEKFSGLNHHTTAFDDVIDIFDVV